MQQAHTTHPQTHVTANIMNKGLRPVIGSKRPSQISNAVSDIGRQPADTSSRKTPDVNIPQSAVQQANMHANVQPSKMCNSSHKLICRQV